MKRLFRVVRPVGVPVGVSVELPADASHALARGPADASVRGPARAGRRSRRLPVAAAPGGRPWVAVAGAAVLAAAAGGIAAGPVAGALGAVYGGGGAGMALRSRRAARSAGAVAATLDTVAEMAAELRAGASPVAVVEAAGAVLAATPAERASVLAACEVSEQTGAPLADVLDRVEAYLRQGNRLRQSVAAHRAGNRATAVLLAVLPVGGIAVGYGIGADPLHLLFHSAPGAACALAACVLQVGGLLWTERLSRVEL